MKTENAVGLLITGGELGKDSLSGDLKAGRVSRGHVEARCLRRKSKSNPSPNSEVGVCMGCLVGETAGAEVSQRERERERERAGHDIRVGAGTLQAKVRGLHFFPDGMNELDAFDGRRGRMQVRFEVNEMPARMCTDDLAKHLIIQRFQLMPI